MPHRFFIPPNWITPPDVTLQGEVARQIKTVLRMQPGDEIVVLDNTGSEWQVQLTRVGQREARAQVIEQRPATGEPNVRLTLYQGTLKGQKFEWVLQKGTELGVAAFVPTLCRRSVVRSPEVLLKKYSRWRQIIREAAEQSGRGKLPQLAQPVTLANAIARTQAADLVIMPWEEAGDGSLKKILGQAPAHDIALFIGPEGGFAPEEAAEAKQAGAKLVTLGRRILRAETAGLAACAAIFFALSEWESHSN